MDVEERNANVERCMGIIHALADRRQRLGVDVEDLIQEGVVAAIAACDSWSPTGGASISTWIYQHAQARMQMIIQRERALRRPNTSETLRSNKDRWCKDDRRSELVSLDSPTMADGDRLVIDTIASDVPSPEDLCAERDWRERVADVVAKVCRVNARKRPRMAADLGDYFGRGYTLRRIAALDGTTAWAAHLRIASSLTLLRGPLAPLAA